MIWFWQGRKNRDWIFGINNEKGRRDWGEWGYRGKRMGKNANLRILIENIFGLIGFDCSRGQRVWRCLISLPDGCEDWRWQSYRSCWRRQYQPVEENKVWLRCKNFTGGCQRWIEDLKAVARDLGQRQAKTGRQRSEW